MQSLVAEALHEVLSVLSDESHAAVVFMLESRHGVNLNGVAEVDFDGIRKGLTELLGSAADILISRMEEYIIQHPVAAPKI